MSDQSDERVIEHIRAVARQTADALAAAGARDEALARFVPAHRVVVVQRPAAMLPLGRVWRLGVFLLDPEGTLFATGTTTRAVEPGYRGYQSVSAEQRRELRGAAFRGPFERGETVNYDAAPLVLDAEALRSTESPLFLRDGRALVRWSPAFGDDAATEFEPYLTERADLLMHPPEGA